MPKRHALALLAAVLLIRLPFLGEALQGDDVYYLLFAENALVDPLHPLQMGFRLQGETVWGTGHTRPPGNAYVLAGLLAAFGGVRETAFHAVYLLFSLTALFSTYFVARRLTARPLWAALLTASAPAFVVNGAKLESDLPLLAFAALGFALFVHERYALAGAALAVMAFFGYQGLFLLPVLAYWAWFRARRRPAAWAALAAAPAALAAWQLGERLSAGTAPAAALAGYFESYGLLALERKWRSGLALLAHMGLILSPALAPVWLGRKATLLVAAALAALLAWLALPGYPLAERVFFGAAAGLGLAILFETAGTLVTGRDFEERFIALWTALFFAASVAVFYAGSARYLLPLTPALAVWAVRRTPSAALLGLACAVHVPLGLALQVSDYRHAQSYRAFAEELVPLVQGRRIWSNAEWGLRYYLGELGGESMLAGQTVPAGAVLVTSELAADVPYAASGTRRELLRREIEVSPLRLIGPGSRSGYSSSEFGVLPFGLGGGVVDTVTAWEIGEEEPTLSYLRMNDPEAGRHLLAGFFPSDGAEWRWMGRRGAALLLAPPDPADFEVEFHIPENALARRVTVTVDGRTAADETYSADGGYRLRRPVQFTPGAPVRVMLSVDRTFSPPGDGRELGVVVIGFGFVTKSEGSAPGEAVP